MKIYIAGKIAGDRRYRAKFREAAKAMEAAGHVVLNPATLPDGLTDGDYMRICMAMVDAADLAVFLPDYQESRGTMVEWAYCQRIGEGEAVVIMLDLAGVCASSGSACTSGTGEPSHVLTAMGLSRKDAYGAIRITLAETNTEAEVDYIGDQLAEIVRKLRG